MTYGHSVVMARGKGIGGWVEVGKEGEYADVCNSVNNKKLKIRKKPSTKKRALRFYSLRQRLYVTLCSFQCYTLPFCLSN